MKTLAQLAREAGIDLDPHGGLARAYPEHLARFRAACRAEALEEAAQIAEAEAVEECAESDAAYNMALKHAAAAIREMK